MLDGGQPLGPATDYHPMWCQPDLEPVYGPSAQAMLPSAPGTGFRSQSDAAAVRSSIVEDALLTEVQGMCHKYGMLDYSKASSDGRAHDWRGAWCMLSGARLWHCRPQDSSRCLAYITLDASCKINAHPEGSGSGHVFGISSGKETPLQDSFGERHAAVGLRDYEP